MSHDETAPKQKPATISEPEMEKMFPRESMGETAENVAEKHKIAREEQDEMTASRYGMPKPPAQRS